MFHTHYPPLVIAYLIALGGWVVAARLRPTWWPRGPAPAFPARWKELGFALLGAVGVVAVGQVWSAGIRLPEDGPAGPALGAIDQVMIFAPILLVPVLRGHTSTTMWLPWPRLIPRVVTGLVLAAAAVTAYSLLRAGASRPWVIEGRIWRYDHLDELVQVLLEDLAIAILFVRIAAAIGGGRATLLVAVLFAAGHVPAMISAGATWPELAGLARDVGLGVAAVLALRRARDVVWFWPIHFCLDLLQFPAVTGAG